MEKRRALISTLYVLAFALLWMQWAPRLFPQFFPQPQPAAQKLADPDADPDADPEVGADEQDEAADVVVPAANGDDDAEAIATELPEHPHRLIELGSLDRESGYFMQVTINTAGAAIETVELNDPRYTSINNRQAPLKIVGDDPQTNDRSLQMSLRAIDDQLKPFGTSLAQVDWQVADQQENAVTLTYTAPDGSLEVRKHYHLNPGDPERPDESVAGHLLDFDIRVRNLADRPQEVQYTLLGPVGLPLEDRANAQHYVEIEAGTLDDPGSPESVSNISMTAAGLVKETEKAERMQDPGRLTVWRAPLKYIGADVSYFAALLVPKEDQLKTKYFEEYQPVVLRKDGYKEKGEWSNISVELTSQTFRLKPQEQLEHKFQAYFGPKRSELLEPLGAGGVTGLGWFSIVALGMLSLLHFFNEVLLFPYGIAIIALTVVVRACLFPISKKIARNQQRMKELQPKMEELRTKYADNKEKQAEAYREFMAKHGFNPLAGCLPMLLQLPIFLGLYRALYASVDLRNAQFLWIDNLAAPDQLFQLPFDLPFLGSYFNLLPLLSMGLFFAQQKLFMPPPTSEEQALQYKMMNIFTLVLGFMFYRFPAGLCLYFITSSLWGICERKLLEKLGLTTTPPAVSNEGGAGGSDAPGGRSTDAPPQPKPPGLLQKLMEAADQAQRQNQVRQHETQREGPGRPDRSNPKRKKGRKSKGRR
jgi:YidC/Oxa1 family membrane protein insertase